MSNIMSVNAFRCRMWDGHSRLEELITEETCRTEIESVEKHGQKMAVLARPLKTDPDYDYELVYGARRLFVARHLNIPLLLELRELSDREAIIALDIENRQRQDLSPYERGRSYAAWIRGGMFGSQDELARTLNVSASQVCRLIRLAQLPTVIVNAFPTPVEICERWGRNLMDLWEDPEKRPIIAAAARILARETPRPPSASVFRRLTAASAEARNGGIAEQAEGHDEVVRDDAGNLLFRVRQHRNDTALMLPTCSVSALTLLQIKEEVAAILHRARTQGPERRIAAYRGSPMLTIDLLDRMGGESVQHTHQ